MSECDQSVGFVSFFRFVGSVRFFEITIGFCATGKRDPPFRMQLERERENILEPYAFAISFELVAVIMTSLSNPTI